MTHHVAIQHRRWGPRAAGPGLFAVGQTLKAIVRGISRWKMRRRDLSAGGREHDNSEERNVERRDNYQYEPWTRAIAGAGTLRWRCAPSFGF